MALGHLSHCSCPRSGWCCDVGPRLEQKPARDSAQGQLSRGTFGFLAFTSCGLLLAILGRDSSHGKTGTVLA